LLKLKSALPILVGFFCLAAPLPAQNSQREVPPAAVGGSGENPPLSTLSVTSEQSRSSDYVIGPEDVLDIDVFNVPELTKTVRVANDGTISLALLGHVQAAGCTTEQLRKELERRWGQSYLENPQVTVFVREFHAQPVSVIGAVERPGIYELKGPRTLIEILSMAGGLAKLGTAPGRTIVVTRRGGFGEELQLVAGMNLVGADKVEINLQRLLYSREAGLNIDIRPFDTVSVSRADIVYVVGDVKRPGGFVLADRENLTVLQALALAEGLNGTASKRQARIIRRSADGSRTEIPVDLTRVLNGKSQDLELAANDVLFVPVSAGKAAARRGAEAVLGTLSGILIYRR
jgi:polysaccharide export outer membrane protein